MNDTETTQPQGGAAETSSTQPSSQSPAPKRPVGTYVIAVVLIVGAILIANVVRETAPAPETDSDVTVTDPVEDVIVTIDEETGEEQKIDLTDFVTFTDLSEFDDLSEATTIINSTQGKPVSGEGAETLVFGVVDAQEENMVYFATSDYNQDTGELFSGVYHYNTITNRWQRVYKQTFEADEDSPVSMLRVVGRAGDSLILLQDFLDNSPGPCSNIWLAAETGPTELLVMDLNDPYGSLTAFPLPETLRQQAEADVATCNQETFGE